MKKKMRKASQPRKISADAERGDLSVKFESRGPEPSRIDRVTQALVDHPSVQEFLGKTRNRMLSFELIEPEVEVKPARPSPPPDLYRATFYDYTNNRTILVDGSLGRSKSVKVSESGFQPLPSSGEFQEAVKILEKDENFGKAIRERQLQPSPAMPPIIEIESPHGRSERTIGVGLLPLVAGAPHEIVGVNLVRRSVVRFDERAPLGSVAHNPICGIPYVQQATANGVDVAPGFRLCNAPATTILDTGSDAGNFLGVAIYVQGQEVVLVSELEASWYRYISEWRLHANGTIQPRFGFSARTNSCVCNVHHHHPYWRFDFDIRTPGNNRVREYNNPPLIGKSNWHTKTFEIRRPRDPARNRKWRVENTVSGEGYDIIPGPDDGVATLSPDWPYPRGDVWFLRYHASELDDGVNCTTGGFGCVTEANLDGFVNGEPISDHDVVVWYAGHVTHDVGAEPPGVFGHICGPDLKPVNW